MKVIDSRQLPPEKIVHCPNGGFISRRILLRDDFMGYSLTETTIPVNGPQFWHYKKHLESCYCVSGRGVLIDQVTGDSHDILPGVTYILNKNDPHTLEALEEMKLVCVFNPPLRGQEIHQKDGSYE